MVPISCVICIRVFMLLIDLIKEATTFGSAACSEGNHEWLFEGGRGCPKGYEDCSQTVYRCTVCGEYDYGYAGGAAWDECFIKCTLEFNV